MSQPRPSLQAFAEAMEAKLRRNDHKTEASKLPISAHLRRLRNELAELEMALDYESRESAMWEAVDCANFALFVFDRLAKSRAKMAKDVR